MRIGTVLGVLLTAFAVLAMGDEQPPPREPNSYAARKAIAAFETTAKNAADDYSRKVEAAGAIATRALEDAKKAALRRTDLDEANAINAASQKIKDASTRPPEIFNSPLAGEWHVTFLNGVSRIYRIFPDGTLGWEENGRAQSERGRLQPGNGGFVVELQPNKIDLLVVAGDRLIDQHFVPASNFPAKMPDTIGIGTK